MRKTAVLTALVLAGFAVTLTGAGEGHKKCPLPTQECLDKMAAKLKASGWVGIEYEVNEETGSPTITKVIPGSPAEGSGLQPGDILLAVNGVDFKSDNEKERQAALKEWKPGQKITYTIKRNGTAQEVNLTLASWPADLVARYIGQHMLEHASVAVAAAGK